MRGRREIKILVAVLAALVLIYVFGARPFEDRDRGRPRDEDLFFPSLDIATVDAIHIRDAVREYSVVRDNEAWILRDAEAGTEVYAAPGMVELAVGQMADLVKTELVSTAGGKEALFGLDDAASVRMTVTAGGDTLAAIVVGREGADRMSSYVREPGSEEIYLASAPLAIMARRGVDSWRVRRLTSFEINDVTEIIIVNGGVRTALERAGGGAWRMTSPMELQAETGEVDAAMLMLDNLKAVGYADDVTPVECGLTAGSGGPETSITVVSTDDSEEIWLSRRDEDTFYASRPDRYDRESVYLVPSRVVSRIVRPPEAFAPPNESAY